MSPEAEGRRINPAPQGQPSERRPAQSPSPGRSARLTQESLFVAEANGLAPTGWAVGPWSPDTLQGSAYGGLLVRALERSDAVPGMLLST